MVGWRFRLGALGAASTHHKGQPDVALQPAIPLVLKHGDIPGVFDHP